MKKSDYFYNNNPTSNDKAHVLVFVLAVDINDVAGPSMFQKMAEIRLAARDLGKIKCSNVVLQSSVDSVLRVVMGNINVL